MKLERLHEYVTITVVVMIGMVAAVLCGKLTGETNLKYLSILMLVGAVIFAAVKYQERTWVLIPISWIWSGKLLILPLPFSVRDIIVMTVAGMFFVFKAVKLNRRKPKIEAVDIWLAVMMAYLIVTYIRNPAGSAATDSERVGGRPYLNTMIAMFSYWVLIRARCSLWQARRLPLWIFLSTAIVGMTAFISQKIAVIGSILGQYYSDFTPPVPGLMDLNVQADGGMERTVAASAASGVGMKALCSYYRPMTLLNPFHIFRFLGFLAILGGIFAAGFRSGFIGAGLIFLLSSYFRKGWGEVLKLVGATIPIIFILVLIQGRVVELPLTMQRTLAFLPGQWSYVATDDAEGSITWRTQMWRLVLTSNKYIDNKVWGDGFGLSRVQLRAIEATMAYGMMSNEQTQETAMLTGNLHSGPLSAIRTVGYVGGIIFYGLMIQMAIVAWRLLRRAIGTPFQVLAYFVCMQAILTPIGYTLIYGQFDFALPDVILSIGLLKLIQSSMDAQEAEPVKKQIVIQRPPQKRRRSVVAPLPA